MTPIRLPSSVPYPWVVMVLCVATLTALASTFVGFGALFPFIQDDLKINRAEIGLISSGRVLGGIGTSLLAGLLADVVGVRRLQSATLFSVVVCLVLFSQMQSLFQGVLLAVLLGVSSAGSFPCFVKAIMDWMNPRHRGLTMGTAEASFPVGGILSALVLTLIAQAYSWRVSVLVIAGGVAVCTIAFFLAYRDPDKDRTAVASATDGSVREKLKMVMRSRGVWLGAAVAAAMGIIMTVVVTFLILFLKETMGMSLVLASACMSVSLAGGAISRIAWGLISDYYLGGRRAGLLAVVAALAGVSIALLALLPPNAGLWLVMPIVFFIGTTGMGWSGLTGNLVAESVEPELTGTAIGLAATVIRLGPMFATPLFGLIVDRTGSYDWAWWMVVGVAGLATLIALGLRRVDEVRPRE